MTKRIGILICSILCCLATRDAYAQLRAPILPEIEPTPYEPQQVDKLMPAITPPGGRLSLYLRDSLLNEFVVSESIDEGPVRDFVLGADVVGTQKTISRSSLELIPSQQSAMFVVRLHGTTTNQSTNYTPQAAVRSCGNYSFQLTKQVAFDGKKMSTWSPAAFLIVEQKNIGVSTRLTPLPLLGPLAEQTALNVANQRLPIAQQIAAQRVTQKVAPKFNDAVDAQIVAINRFLSETLEQQLKEYRLDFLQVSASTTDQHLKISLQAGPAIPAQTQDFHQLNPASSGAIIVDEDFLNSQVDRLPLAGLRITDTQLEKLVAGDMQAFTAASNPQLFTLVFEEQQPLRLVMRNGAIEIEARIRIQPVLGQGLPAHRFVIRLEGELQTDGLQLIPTVVDIQPVQITNSNNGLVDSSIDLMKKQLQNELAPLKLPRQVSIPLLQGKYVELTRLETVQQRVEIEFHVEEVRDEVLPQNDF